MEFSVSCTFKMYFSEVMCTFRMYFSEVTCTFRMYFNAVVYFSGVVSLGCTFREVMSHAADGAHPPTDLVSLAR